MGKGGQRAHENAAQPKVWKSSYDPLSKNAPKLPTKGEIKAAIPAHCFVRSGFKSMMYVVRDSIMAAAMVYATSQVLTTDLPTSASEALVFVFGWSFYAFWMGSILTGHWVLAHECGHGAFSPSQDFNDFIGFILHQALLVPYYAWQYTHAKHHRRTNHLNDGESHVPSTKEDNGLGENLERNTFYAVWHEAMGDGAFAAFQIWSHLFLGWPLYLLGLASTGRLDVHGKPLDGRISDHFRPSSPMFPEKISFKIALSTAGVVATLGFLGYLMYTVGVVPVICWYWGPYTITNAWLVLYTWLQHTDPSIPHYGEGEWTWVRGALSTIDRDYGIFDFFHHRIGSTHVLHHLFHECPFYNAWEATQAVKAFLEPKGLYNYDPTPWPVAMWRIARTCHYVEDTTGIQYLKSLEDVPLSKDLKEKSS
mmetsp:Transcript_22920/g.34748  ORF Transcript_22920/g.34748 Transcript_22920/m.34748 type:complete len:422 (-) Transcript_22920:2272-3537(-)|eukprot:CAMPEP_0178920588 /NCGR_PEP_ID=MMETSP0786-20121207/15087_1 /TAXON_ID=186022 /ORGANISM="Thalassionema frauenfeldii, Strain CCMP 1798" /LENGTH=421 /DNA_ID=CAMNT_0020594669 /DNA_START=1088 /DNA_END=2353 /DNA_ORIENTATION=-